MKLKRGSFVAVRGAFFLALLVGAYSLMEWRGLIPSSVQNSGEALRTLASVEPEPVFDLTIKRNSTLFDALLRAGLSAQDVNSIVAAAKPIKNLNRMRAGTPFRVEQELGPVQGIASVEFKFSPIEFLKLERLAQEWKATWVEHEVDVQLVTYTGLVTTSLWESALDANMNPDLIAELAEIFAWQVDFSREVRTNDRWRLTVERKYARGNPIGWGRIVAAEYLNAGELYQAILLRHDGRTIGYFAPDGTSLKKMFLKSPIRFGRISSRFNLRRFHPILKKRRPHFGVDYAAPRGTPVRAVGDGTISFAGWKGGAGKTIWIRHNSIYKTAYKHLNGYAPGVRRGSKVRQGQIIGYVGSTGLSTGPHLHFEFFEGGRYVDPLGRKFPSADPVPTRLSSHFESAASESLAQLPPWHHPGVTLSGPIVIGQVGSDGV